MTAGGQDEDHIVGNFYDTMDHGFLLHSMEYAMRLADSCKATKKKLEKNRRHVAKCHAQRSLAKITTAAQSCLQCRIQHNLPNFSQKSEWTAPGQR